MLQDDVKMLGVPPTWDFWAKEVGVRLPKFSNVRKLGQANMIIQAAKAGHGVAMGRSPLVIDGLLDGSLVCPLTMVAQSQLSYWFVCRHESIKTKRIKVFRNWLREEVAKLPDVTKLLVGKNPL
jgi:LysR family glycine cleavage system transcriptional activator